MDRSEISEKIWEHVGPSVFQSRQDFMNDLAAWEIKPRMVDGQLIGATLQNGPEFHFITLGKRKVLTAALITECLQPIIDEHGYVTTKTPKEDERQRRFNQLIGFDGVGEDEFYTYFRMERLNLHRGNQCQS